MISYFHKVKPLVNWTLEKVGLYDSFHTIVIKLFSKREKLSKKYIKGNGIEVGALHTPLKIFNNGKVTYVDRMGNESLRDHYPELGNYKFVKVDIVDDGEELRKIKSNSQDFVIANHFLEHCENPIEVIKNHLRVLKQNGIIYWAIPDKRYIFDSVRDLTTVSHLENDYKYGPQFSRKGHYDEWADKFLKLKGKTAAKKSKELMKERYSIHFHVWTKESFMSFIKFAVKIIKLPFEIVEVVPNINEFIVILKKK